MTVSLTTNEKDLIGYSVKSGGIAEITFNRPDKLNSFNRRMALELLAALKAAASDVEVRVIKITAIGKAFCAGQDLSEVMPSEGRQEPIDLGAIVHELYNPIIAIITATPKPVIAVVNGVAAGAGATIALACDFVIALESANFIFAFAKIGLIPDSGGTFFLPRLLGLARAKSIAMLGEKISGLELAQLGAIYKSGSAEDLQKIVDDLTVRLSESATLALGHTKLLLNQSSSCALQAQLKAEEAAQRACGLSSDYRAGVEAFSQKKSARFSGR